MIISFTNKIHAEVEKVRDKATHSQWQVNVRAYNIIWSSLHEVTDGIEND